MPPAKKTLEERIAVLDAKIERKKQELQKLEEQKQRLLHPVNMRTVLTAAKEAGMTPEEIAKKLGLDI